MGDYRRTLTELYSLAPKGIRPGLERVRAALARLGDPQRAFDVVHIAGTNGKGSCARMMAEGIEGGRVGLFTSPHLHSLTERFVVDGQPVGREEVTEVWEASKDALHDLTFFESVTALAFELFRRRGVDLAVLETGLGGRLDATNVFERPRVTAITRVALDHASFLGAELGGVAREKAGILKPGVVAVVGPQESAVDEVVERVAHEVGAPLVRPRFEGPPQALRVRVGDRRSPPLNVALAGDHQRENAAVAVAALLSMGAPVRVDPARAVRATWPGRLEQVLPNVLVDVAHNPSGARALARYLDARPSNRRVLLFGSMKDKDWPAMLAALRPRADELVLTRAPLGRAEDPERMAQAGEHVEADIDRALEKALALAGTQGSVVVAGSLFVVAEARARLLGIEADPPIAL